MIYTLEMRFPDIPEIQEGFRGRVAAVRLEVLKTGPGAAQKIIKIYEFWTGIELEGATREMAEAVFRPEIERYLSGRPIADYL